MLNNEDSIKSKFTESDVIADRANINQTMCNIIYFLFNI